MTEYRQTKGTPKYRLATGTGGFLKYLKSIEIATWPEFTDITEYFNPRPLLTGNIAGYRQLAREYRYIIKGEKGRVLISKTAETDTNHDFKAAYQRKNK
jgi:hypothetical protein